MPPKSKAEIKYLKEIKDYKDIVFSAKGNAVQEGFEFFQSEEYTSKYPDNKMNIKKILLSYGSEEILNRMTPALLSFIWKRAANAT